MLFIALKTVRNTILLFTSCCAFPTMCPSHFTCVPVQHLIVGQPWHPFAGGVSGSAENQLVCFRLDLDARTCVVREATELHKEGIADIALRGDGRIFATAGWDCKVRMYSYRKATCLAILKVSSATVLRWVAACRCYGLDVARRDSSLASSWAPEPEPRTTATACLHVRSTIPEQ